MPLPAAFTTELAKDLVLPRFYLEIEGLPFAYGNFGETSGWYLTRTETEQRDGVRDVMLGVPQGVEQEARPLDGDTSIGQMTLRFVADDPTDTARPFGRTMLELHSNVGRIDKLLVNQAESKWVASTPFAAGAIIRPNSGAAGADANRWWRNAGAGGTSGGTEPTWDGLTEADGTVTWTRMGLRDLPDNAAITDVVYAGTADDADYPGATGIFYLGRETFRYASKVTAPNGGGYFASVTRASFLLPGVAMTQAHTEGDLISPYPRFIVSRRAALLMVSLPHISVACASTFQILRFLLRDIQIHYEMLP